MKKALSDIDAAALRGRTVVVRADLNVPLDGGRITDDKRIRASLPTLEALLTAGARVVLLSHLGRPKGEVVQELSLAPVAARLDELLDHSVRFADAGADEAELVAALEDGSLLLLENTRFHPGETANDEELGRRWASYGTLFVNDAFGTAHRAHASTVGIAKNVIDSGGEAVSGHLLARELEFLGDVVQQPRRPFVAIVGGAKISSKIGVISELLPRVDRLLIGGAMANTFFRALDLETGASLVEEDAIGLAADLIAQGDGRLVLPVDCVVAPKVAPRVETRVVARESVGPQDMIVDIGPETASRFARMVTASKTIVWNGPMGVFEIDDFARGTIAVAEAVADACDTGAVGVLGGGDSAAAVQRAGVAYRVSHVSTGGGASLELLAGESLPGVEALSGREPVGGGVS